MNIRHHIVNPQQHIIIPVAQHLVTQRFKHRSPPRIVHRPIQMLAAIDLDDQLRLRADEVGDVAGDRHLAPEAEAVELARAQALPEMPFGIGCGVAQCACVGTQPVDGSPPP